MTTLFALAAGALLMLAPSSATDLRSRSAGGRSTGGRRRRSPRRSALLRRPSTSAASAATAGLVAVAGLTLAGPLGGVIGLALVAPLLALLSARRGRVPTPNLGPGDRGMPLALVVGAALLDAGRPVAAAVDAAAVFLQPPAREAFAHVAGLLALGTDPDEAWRPARSIPDGSRVADLGEGSAINGARLARGWRELAEELREETAARAAARCARVGVWVLAPLGLCFLPAFVCLGIAPEVIGLARDLFPGPP